MTDMHIPKLEEAGIPLGRLVSWPGNPRSNRTDEVIEDFAGSIDVNGVLLPFIVRPVEGTETYEVIDGESRRQALERLAAFEESPIEESTAIKCLVGEMDDATALRVATLANEERMGMHPMDVYESVEKMVAAGYDKATIATWFGWKSDKTVDRYLALAGLAPELRQAFRDGKMTMAVAKVFTLVDHDRQRAEWAEIEEEAENTPWFEWPYDQDRGLRHELIGTPVAMKHAIFDRAQYTGGIVRDLFTEEDEEQAADRDRFMALQLAALEEKKARLEAEGAAFVHIVTGNDWFNPNHRGGWEKGKKADDDTGVVFVLKHDGSVADFRWFRQIARPSDAHMPVAPEPAEPTEAETEAKATAKRDPYALSGPQLDMVDYAIGLSAFHAIGSADDEAILRVVAFAMLSAASNMRLEPGGAMRLGRAAQEDELSQYEAIDAVKQDVAGNEGRSMEEGFVDFDGVEVRCDFAAVHQPDEIADYLDGLGRDALIRLIGYLAVGTLPVEQLRPASYLGRQLGTDPRAVWLIGEPFLRRYNRDKLAAVAKEVFGTAEYHAVTAPPRKGEAVKVLTRYFGDARSNAKGRRWWPNPYDLDGDAEAAADQKPAGPDDLSDDAEALASAGMGTDEDYGGMQAAE